LNLFIREWKANFKTLLLWSLGIFFMIAGGMSKYSAASKSGQSMNELISKMPRSIQALFGVGTFDLSKAIGFYGVIFLYLVLMATIHSSLLGATIISKEERDKTSEFLYVKPITRRYIISQKIGISILMLVIINLVTLFTSLWMVGLFSSGEAITAIILKLMAGLFFLQLIFLFLGLGISALSKNPRTAPPTVSGLLLIFFFLYQLVKMNTHLAFLRFLTPFCYFDANELMGNAGFNPIYLFISAVIIGIMVIIMYTFYEKRDLTL
jgi:ABC-2 type transport system permease protein